MKSSKYRGVTLQKNGYWKASITDEGKNFYIGSFMSEVEAAKAYDSVAKDKHGVKAKLNFS